MGVVRGEKTTKIHTTTPVSEGKLEPDLGIVD